MTDLPPRPEDRLLGFDETTPVCPCMRWAWPDAREAIRTNAQHHPACDGTGQRKDAPLPPGTIVHIGPVKEI